MLSRLFPRRPASEPASVFFLHLPKTAGTSFRAWAWQHYPQAAIFPNAADLAANDGNYPRPQSLLKLPQQRKAGLRLVLGHFPVGFARELPPGFRRGVMLRDPYERVFSYLRYSVQQERRDSGRRDGLAGWIGRHAELFESQIGNLQVRFLSRPRAGIDLASPIDEADLAVAEAALAAFDFVGLTERYEDSTRLAARLFGWRYRRHRRLNVSLEPLEVDEGLRQRIESRIALDRRLYAAAQRRLSALLGETR